MSGFNFFADRPVETYRKTDSFLVALSLLLWGLGIVTLMICSNENGIKFFDDSWHFVKRQLLSSAFGFAGLLFFAIVDVKVIRKALPFIVLGAVFLCLLTFVPGIGVERNGAKRWIRLPFISTFQPSEALKFASVLFLANLLDKQAAITDEDEKNVFPAVAGLVIFTVLIFAQKDLSTGIFVFAVGIIMFFVTGSKIAWFLPLFILGSLICALLVLMEPYRMDRIIAFLEPNSHLDGVNFQPLRAKIAITNGGLLGQGFGSGLLKVRSIPEVQADYIFAGWAEATGFVGVIAYFIILALFCWRGYAAAMKCSSRFAAFTSFGFVTSILLQSLMNIAVVGGVLPSTGIPLPFFSSGGSSIIFTMVMCGFLFQTSRIDDEYEDDGGSSDIEGEYIPVGEFL